MYQAVISCPNCKRLYDVPSLHTECSDGKEIPLECPECGAECAELSDMEKVRCPQCRSKLEVSLDGRWD